MSSEITSRQALWILAAAGAAFIVGMLLARPFPVYSMDFLWYAGLAADPDSWWNALMSLDDDNRYRPGVHILSAIGYGIGGISQTRWLLIAYPLHVANSFAVYFLCRRFAAGPFAALTASLLFLTSSLNWSSLETVADFCRRGTLLLYIVGIFVFLRYLRRDAGRISLAALGCYVAILLTNEDGITLPVMLLAAGFLAPADSSVVGKPCWTRSAVWTVGLCFALAACLLMFLRSHVQNVYGLHYGWHSVLKMFTLPREALLHLFVYRRNWGFPDALWLRMAPLFFLGGAAAILFLATAKSKGLDFARSLRPVLLFAGTWVLVTVFPFLSRPSPGGEWYNRYMYFPSVGIFILAALFLDACRRRLGEIFPRPVFARSIASGVVGFLAVFGLLKNILIQQDVHRVSSQAYAADGEGPLFWGLHRQIHSLGKTSSEGIGLVVRGSPFSRQRLQTILDFSRLPRVTVGENAQDLAAKGLPVYAISFQEGQWGKIAPCQD